MNVIFFTPSLYVRMILRAHPDEYDIDEIDDASLQEAEIVLGATGSQDIAIQQSGGDDDRNAAQSECEPGEQGHEHNDDTQEAECRWLPHPDRQGALAYQTVIVDVAYVVDKEHTHRDESADGSGVDGLHLTGVEGLSRGLVLQPDGSPGGDDAIVEKHEDVGYAQIGERIGCGGVKPGEQDGCEANGDDCPASYPAEYGAEQDTDGQRDATGCPHRTFGHSSLSQSTFEAHPTLLVCAAPVVVVVVDEVAQDLQGEGTGGSQDGCQMREGAALMDERVGNHEPDQHGTERCEQGLWPDDAKPEEYLFHIMLFKFRMIIINHRLSRLSRCKPLMGNI